MGNRTSSSQHVKYCWNTVVFCFGFYFMSPKWSRTKIKEVVFGVSIGLSLPMACTEALQPLEN